MRMPSAFIVSKPRGLPALLSAALAMAICLPCRGAEEPLPAVVEFNRDIRPILSNNCYQCHGPDQAKRKADLRLDLEAEALADRGGYRAIEPGKITESELYLRVTAEDEDERMPPPKSGRMLDRRQVELLGRWIAQGAKWQKHWSLLPPRRPALPDVNDKASPHNPIDRFVRARLEREGLAPAPEADRATLLRRVTLDITGLPPTPAEDDAFLADCAPDAYEKVVDRLLASPRYGERMAVRWLEAARYADTNGYQSDGERFMWRWRDWVIDAFNHNMPFDQFTIEQLAGDLLPNPSLEQQIATGFNRNHRGNGEGGIIPEEYAVEYVADRVETTSTVWLGLTVGCARCHDHKFDPITQKDFYQLFAFFNNIAEQGRAVKYGNSPPLIPTPTREQQAELATIEHDLAAAETRFKALAPDLAEAQKAWEKEAAESPRGKIDWTLTAGLLARFELGGHTSEREGRTNDARFRGGEPAFAPGRTGHAAAFDGSRFVDAGDLAGFGFYDSFSLAAWVYPEGERGGTILSRMTDTARADGYSLAIVSGKLQLNLVKRWLDDALRVQTVRTFEPGCWHHVIATYDGSRVAEGVRIYVDGKPEPLEVLLDELNQSFRTSEPLRIGGGGGPGDRFHGRIDDARVYRRALGIEEAELVANPDRIDEILAAHAPQRNRSQARKLHAYFLASHAPEQIQRSHERLLAVRRRRDALVEGFPTTMVMQELPAPRPTFLLIRGQYDKREEKVESGVPGCLPPLPEGAPRNRLGLARWLVDPANPLPARVAVNRFWQLYFGTGLVKTGDDFGAQGEWPTHPELLDWLATELVRSGWNVKALQKTIVTSATYRQSSRLTAALHQRDPENQLLARGPRLRLPAEMIRDQALALAGLLVEHQGGPSVKPYQPEGLWKDLAEVTDYPQDHGPSLYRRSLYTFWKRTVAPPEMLTFDSPTRETCSVRFTRTNTPLQALTLLNDVTFVEAARLFAQRLLTEGGCTTDERLTFAFRLATARRPSPAELEVLRRDLAENLAHFQADTKAARALASVGEAPRPETLDLVELAAYTATANLILNLEETITKE
jgi:hypothetical protein